jgi:hypothetical protein
MKVRIFKDRINYIVQVGGTLFEMSSDADMPNGVNHVLSDNAAWVIKRGRALYSKLEIKLSSAPEGVRRAIKARMEA